MLTQIQPLGLPDWYDDAAGSLEQAWGLLTRGVNDRHSGFHTPTVTNVGANGFPHARVMVLREAHAQNRILRFHTDVRSEKIADMKLNPRVSVTGYDARAKVQIRIEGRVHVHFKDDIAQDAWRASKAMSQMCYGVSPGSGSLIEEAGGYTMPTTAQEAAMGEAHFCALRIHVSTLEWLYLARQGHRRLRCVYDDKGHVQADWLVP
jgi:pyridoxamine 5'-phosphate oxidase